MEQKLPRLVIAGTNSGCGKTTVTCAVLQALVNRRAPGLCRDIDLRTERFNQHETDGSLLCEFGASGNTLSQALRTARVFADVLVSFINGVAAAS